MCAPTTDWPDLICFASMLSSLLLSMLAPLPNVRRTYSSVIGKYKYRDRLLPTLSKSCAHSSYADLIQSNIEYLASVANELHFRVVPLESSLFNKSFLDGNIKSHYLCYAAVSGFFLNQETDEARHQLTHCSSRIFVILYF